MEEPNHVTEKMEKGERFGRAEQKEEKEEGGKNHYSDSISSHHNGEDDKKTSSGGNGHNSRGVVARLPSALPNTTGHR